MMTVPALRELRRILPKAQITLATRSWAKGLFADADFLDNLLIQDGRGLRATFAQASDLRQGNFDLALVFPNSFGTALVPALARVPFRFGYATSGRGLLLTHSLPLPGWRSSKHEVFYYLNIVAELERSLNDEKPRESRQPDASLEMSEARKSQGSAILSSHGVRADAKLIALCPGSINSRAKRWPAERYAALADMLMDRLEAQVLLIGSPEELDVSLEVGRHMRHQATMLTGKTDLAQLVSVLGLVDLVVTNDTGPAHIASALGRPTLVIFGPTNPLTTRPFSPLAELVRHPPDCAPCMLRDCPIDHRCMTAISPDDVFERAAAMLSSHGGKTSDGWCSGQVDDNQTIHEVTLNNTKYNSC